MGNMGKCALKKKEKFFFVRVGDHHVRSEKEGQIEVELRSFRFYLSSALVFQMAFVRTIVMM